MTDGSAASNKDEKTSAPHLEDPPFWPWIVLMIGFSALRIGTLFVLSRLLLTLQGIS